MKSYKETLFILVPTLIIFFGIIWLATPAPKSAGQTDYSQKESGALMAENPKYDFGTISMAKGKVTNIYSISHHQLNYLIRQYLLSKYIHLIILLSCNK